MFLIRILNPTRYKRSNNGRGVILNRISRRCYMKDSEEEPDLQDLLKITLQYSSDEK